MASAMRKMAVYLGLVEDQDRYDEYGEDYDDYPPDAHEADPAVEAERPRAGTVGTAGTEPRGATVATLADRRPVATAPHPRRAEPARITTLHPRTYNEARTIGEHFRDGTPVIMNLSEMDDGDAKRLVDFAAGLVFGMRGTIERVTAKVFLLSPADVQVTAEEKAQIAENGFFNQS
ncbi:MAG TPA: cell division protein SepF [Jiangellales bacterium]|nr:cell division protein SepF [Jiangellales bacterium]